MSKIDFLLPKVDGKLDAKTPSRWYISDYMLAEEFAHFADGMLRYPGKRRIKYERINIFTGQESQS